MVRARKKFLLEKRVQLTLGLRIVAQWFVFLAVSIVVTTFLYMPTNLDQSLWQDFRVAVFSQLPSLTVFFALLPWFIHDSLKLSNRFAGPMVRLRGAIIQLTNGEESQALSFRQGDYWTDIASEFNKLRDRVLEERGQLELQPQVARLQAEPTDTEEETLPLPIINPVTINSVVTPSPSLSR